MSYMSVHLSDSLSSTFKLQVLFCIFLISQFRKSNCYYKLYKTQKKENQRMHVYFFKSSNPVNKASNYKTDRMRLYITSKVKYDATLQPSTEGLPTLQIMHALAVHLSCLLFHDSIIRISRVRFNGLFQVKNSSVGLTKSFSKPKNKNPLPTDNYY